MKRLLIILAALLLATATVAACGGDTDQESALDPAPDARAGETVIVIEDFTYTTPQSVAPGATITVRNEDDVAHTVTADSGELFDVEVPASSEATFTAPEEAGSFGFYCTYHPNMTSTLTVA